MALGREPPPEENPGPKDVVTEAMVKRKPSKPAHEAALDSAAWRRVRLLVLDRAGGRCEVVERGVRCARQAVVCGHIVPRVLSLVGPDGRLDPEHLDPANLRAECKHHSDSSGARLGNMLRRGRGGRDERPRLPRPDAEADRRAVPVEVAPDPTTPGPDDPVWSAAPWLADLLPVPEAASWPRLMTAPHPDAVASHGPAAVAWIEARSGLALHWFQRLLTYRLLEVDADGELVWREVLVSMSRQLGKSVWLREVGLWRVHHAHLFGQPQLVVHVADRVETVRSVTAPLWLRCHEEPETYRVLESNGRPSVTLRSDGSAYLLRAARAVFGLSPTVGYVDEAWAVQPRWADDGLEPALLAAVSGQMVIVSTAHRAATGLVLGRRRSALEHLADPRRTLLVEWSAPTDAALGDVAAWRAASPRWTPRRQELLEDRLAATRRGVTVDPSGHESDPVQSFRSQYLNIWPKEMRTMDEPGEPLVDEQTWRAATRPLTTTPFMVAAIETNRGHGAAVGWASLGRDRGRRVVYGSVALTDSVRAAAMSVETIVARGTELAAVLVGAAGVDTDTAVQTLPAAPERRGTTEFTTGLVVLRELLAVGELVHDGDDVLTEQMLTLRVGAAPAGGLRVVSSGRCDALRAFVWAVAEVAGGVLDGWEPS